MSTTRTDLINSFITSMKQINGISPYVFNLNNNVIRLLERVNVKLYDFSTYPTMFIYATSKNDYLPGGYLLENMAIYADTAFNLQLSPENVDDFISDMQFAMRDNIKLGGTADFAKFVNFSGKWLPEDKLTIVTGELSVQFKRYKL